MYLQTRIWEKYYWYMTFTIIYNSPSQPDNKTNLLNFLDFSIKTVPCYQYRDLMKKYVTDNNINNAYNNRSTLIDYWISLYNWVQKNTKRHEYIDRTYTDKAYGYPAFYVNYKEYLVYLDQAIALVTQGVTNYDNHSSFLTYLGMVYPIHELRNSLENLSHTIKTATEALITESTMNGTTVIPFEVFRKQYITQYKECFKSYNDVFLSKNICKYQFKL